MVVEQNARKGCDSQVTLINSSWDYNASIIHMILSTLLGFMADGASMMISWSHQSACSTIRETLHPIYHRVAGIYSFSLKRMVMLGSVLLYIQMHGSKNIVLY